MKTPRYHEHILVCSIVVHFKESNSILANPKGKSK